MIIDRQPRNYSIARDTRLGTCVTSYHTVARGRAARESSVTLPIMWINSWSSETFYKMLHTWRSRLHSPRGSGGSLTPDNSSRHHVHKCHHHLPPSHSSSMQCDRSFSSTSSFSPSPMLRLSTRPFSLFSSSDSRSIGSKQYHDLHHKHHPEHHSLPDCLSSSLRPASGSM